MKSFLLCIALYGVVAFGATTAQPDDEVELPDYVQTCDQDDPQRDLCIKNSLQSMLPKLDKGIKSLNIPPMDPYVLGKNRFDYKNGNMQGSVAVKNVKIYGMTRTQIKNVKTDINDQGMTAEFEFFMPRVFIEGNYKADVTLNDLKLSPKGYFNVTISDVLAKDKIAGVFETVKGKKFLRVTNFEVTPEIGDMKFYASGLFPDPQLNAFVLDFVNQYWPELYKQLLPQTRQYWEPMVLDYMNQFLSRIPFNKMLTKKE